MSSIIEFNDLELTLFRGADRLYRAPGYASVREGELLFGEPAVRLARIHPQQANQQYFNRMNADPLPQPTRTAANHADLVYLHLKELARELNEDAILAVPGTLNGEQLGVLLGICQEAGIEVGGFVNAAVAAVATTAVPEKTLYVDVYLQHMLVSELAVAAEVRHGRSFEVRDAGFSSLLDGWVNLIADRFVQETRFDPLHTADSEQQLYNQVYDWVMGPHHRSDVAVEVSHGEQKRRVEVPTAQLEAKAQQRVDRFIDALPADTTLALSARAARLPGFSARLSAAGYELRPLAADAVAAGCNEHMALVRTVDSELRLVSRLPHDNAQTESSSVATTQTPTHLLRDHRAVALDHPSVRDLVKLSEGGPVLATHGSVTVNGERPSSDRYLRLGDEITSDAGTFTAIRLES